MPTFDEWFSCSRIKKILATLTRRIVCGGSKEHREARITTMRQLHRTGGLRGKWLKLQFACVGSFAPPSRFSLFQALFIIYTS